MADMLTIDTLPTHLPVFEPETDTLCRYCQELTQLTMSGMLTSEQQRVIEDLLFELVSYFSDRLKAPRWLRTEQGDMKSIQVDKEDVPAVTGRLTRQTAMSLQRRPYLRGSRLNNWPYGLSPAVDAGRQLRFARPTTTPAP